MNKQEALQKIEELKKFIKNEDKQEDWKPEYRSRYYYIDDCGDVCKCGWDDDDGDNLRYEINNVFKTEELAQLEADKRKAYVKIQRYAKRVNEGWEVEAGNSLVVHYIQLNVDEFLVNNYAGPRNIFDVYFKSQELAEQALKDLNAEYKLLFGIN